MTASRVLRIRERLLTVFAPSELEVIDESEHHRGHPGARDGRGHFRVKIISEHFAGRKTLERHRMVYAALDALLKTDIHALSVQAAATEAELQN